MAPVNGSSPSPAALAAAVLALDPAERVAFAIAIATRAGAGELAGIQLDATLSRPDDGQPGRYLRLVGALSMGIRGPAFAQVVQARDDTPATWRLLPDGVWSQAITMQDAVRAALAAQDALVSRRWEGQ